MRRSTLALLSTAMLMTGCATPPTAEQIEAKKKKDQAFGQMLGLALLASSMPESNDNKPVSFYETTVTPEDAKLIEQIKTNYQEKQKWDETISDLSAYQTIELIDLRREDNSLYWVLHGSAFFNRYFLV